MEADYKNCEPPSCHKPEDEAEPEQQEDENSGLTREKFMEIAKSRAKKAFENGTAKDAAMSFLGDIDRSKDTSYQLYPPGHAVCRLCLFAYAEFTPDFIDGFN